MAKGTGASALVGVFILRSRAQQAVEQLMRVGFRVEQIGVIAHLVLGNNLLLRADRDSTGPCAPSAPLETGAGGRFAIRSANSGRDGP